MWGVIGTLLAIGAVGILAIAGVLSLIIGAAKVIKKTVRYMTTDDDVDINVKFKKNENNDYRYY